MFRTETPHQPVIEIQCSEFRCGRSYTNWRPRGSGDWLLIYTEQGSGRVVSDAGAADTTVGDVILYAPADPQDYGTSPETGKWRLIWAHFTARPHWLAWLTQWPVASNGVRLLHLDAGEAREGFRAALRRMIGFAPQEIPGAADFAVNALEEALLWANIPASRSGWLKLDPRVRRAMDWLTAHGKEPFSMRNLACACGVSASRLAHLFKEQTGTSPQRFLEQQRMKQASALLRHTSLTIAEVAEEVGYRDPFYFSSRFRRHAGKSPTAFRRAGSGPATGAIALR